MSMTFAEFERVNLARLEQWHARGDEAQPSAFSPAESMVALVGEVGELADALGCPPQADAWQPEHALLGVTVAVGNLASVLKMRARVRNGIKGNKFEPTDEHVAQALAEIMDATLRASAVIGIAPRHTGASPASSNPSAADEIGDVMAYLGLVAASIGVSLERATAVKFNAVSERHGFAHRLPVPLPMN